MRASCGLSLGSILPLWSPAAHASTSSCTPAPFHMSFPSTPSTPELGSDFTVTIPLEMEMVPFSQDTEYSSPSKVVPKDNANVPETPDFNFQTASTVSTGGRCFWICDENAEILIGSYSGPRSSRVPAMKWTPPSSKKPPWYRGVLRHSVSAGC